MSFSLPICQQKLNGRNATRFPRLFCRLIKNRTEMMKNRSKAARNIQDDAMADNDVDKT